MLGTHHSLGTWRKKVTSYIALSEFSRQKFIAGGLPAEKIVVKPNFVSPDPGPSSSDSEYVLFVGRISREKGVEFLFDTWKEMVDRTIPLRIIGDGPLRRALEDQKEGSGLSNIHFEGRLQKDKVLHAMKRARFVVFPSECYENFPLVIVEAYACGIPVIAPRLGAMEELVGDGMTGLHFESAVAEDFAAKVHQAWTHPAQTAEMGRGARAVYEAKYTAEHNYHVLMQVYRKAACQHSE